MIPRDSIGDFEKRKKRRLQDPKYEKYCNRSDEDKPLAIDQGRPKATTTCMARRPNEEADARRRIVANTTEDPCEI
jgi:hypothetical protein